MHIAQYSFFLAHLSRVLKSSKINKTKVKSLQKSSIETTGLFIKGMLSPLSLWSGLIEQRENEIFF